MKVGFGYRFAGSGGARRSTTLDLNLGVDVGSITSAEVHAAGRSYSGKVDGATHVVLALSAIMHFSLWARAMPSLLCARIPARGEALFEPVELIHCGGVEREVEQSGVLGDALLVRGLRQHHEAVLGRPAEEHLRGRSLDPLRDVYDDGVVEPLAAREGTVGLYDDVVLLAECTRLAVLQEGVDFDLIDRGGSVALARSSSRCGTR